MARTVTLIIDSCRLRRRLGSVERFLYSKQNDSSIIPFNRMFRWLPPPHGALCQFIFNCILHTIMTIRGTDTRGLVVVVVQSRGIMALNLESTTTVYLLILIRRAILPALQLCGCSAWGFVPVVVVRMVSLVFVMLPGERMCSDTSAAARSE